jgi:hypothetical protein
MKVYNGIINISEPDDDYSIYKIYSSDLLDKSIYIGTTSNYKQRVYKHSISRKYKKYKNKPLYIWMNDLIENQLGGKVLFEVIETGLNKEKSFSREIELIEEFRNKNFTILNISEGGKGPLGQIPWNKGKSNIYSKEYLKKLSESHIGKVGGMLGKTHSNKTKNLISLKNKERVARKWLNPRKKKVYKYNNDNFLINEYSCLEEAGIKESVSPTSIGEWCRKEKKSKNGFTYSYLKIN